ncbi:hypothetical protein HY633_05305 [Candidatus Uhrbacteria bacterium]|nr:hypothetical protein [Candidatus Uhrbacteria bacterium]
MVNDADTGYMVTFDVPMVPGVRLPIASAAGSRAAMRRLWDDEFFACGAVRFVIADRAGKNVVAGAFNGPDRDRDVPLMIARIHARGAIELTTLRYGDGVTYAINEELGFAARR